MNAVAMVQHCPIHQARRSAWPECIAAPPDLFARREGDSWFCQGGKTIVLRPQGPPCPYCPPRPADLRRRANWLVHASANFPRPVQ